MNQLHWKSPRAAMAGFGHHQDIRFRRPRSAYRDPAVSYVQTGIAIDPHRRENGAMLVYPVATAWANCPVGEDPVMDRRLEDEDERRVGLDPAGARVLELESRATWRSGISTPCTALARIGQPWIAASTSTATSS
jgi:hypothetical protein